MSRSRSDLLDIYNVKLVEWNTTEMFYRQKTEAAKREYEKCTDRWECTQQAVAASHDVIGYLRFYG